MRIQALPLIDGQRRIKETNRPETSVTSEVCLMNRHAVVLAADSATTVSQWNGSQREIRYFKGANKIHALSDHAPVGLMIFAGADILDVPWEVVIKAFKKSVSDKTFNTVDDYAKELFLFLEAETKYFPLEVQKSTALDNAKRLAYLTALEVRDKGDPSHGPKEWTAEFDKKLPDLRAAVDAKPLNFDVSVEWIEKNIIVWATELATLIDDYLNIPEREPRPSDFIALAELSLWALIKDAEKHLGSTGLVFAGYGDHDIFPSYVHYSSSGLVGGKHLIKEVERQSITHEISSNLSAFAQKGMIDTFELGLDSSVFVDASLSFDEAADSFAKEIFDEMGLGDDSKPNIKSLKDAARNKFCTDWIQKARQKHALPLKRVLGSLPIIEMAELAETLVNLQSLKEKVTKPSEEVGGPVDVAVITKADGLIWIRRKHYFDPALNARYMARLGGQYR